MTTKSKTRKTPAAKDGINPKLAALAAKFDTAESELKRVLDDVSRARRSSLFRQS